MSGIVGGAGSKSGVIGTTELDYEEGTYVPTMTYSSGGGSMTMKSGEDTLMYTKIGRKVFIQGKLEISTQSSGAGYVQISLPFTVGDFDDFAERFGSLICAGDISTNWTGVPGLQANAGATTITMYDFWDGSPQSTGGHMTSNTMMFVDVNYMVN
jgi:hypothetical protein|tara:strand:+ start:198 stop:662 length:465 start_codon:yes stop_codon:yes gene_type:complete